uniref:Major facilitator superfamily associated domain-containing protein n=1 Tax=Ciona intestinalis TaxID=7719 RepID=H2XPZ1_CIOIN
MDYTVTARMKYSFGVGHVLNDLCASMWFSYLLIFFHKILQFSNSMAGNILLVGQIADGIATPFVGYESDKSYFACKYGKRKSWHLVGTVCVAMTFPLLFLHCIGCNESSPEYAQFIYYAPLVVIFQFGWAATQINHLALIPDLTNNDEDRVSLNAIRYAFTVFSGIIVYGVAWGILGMQDSSSDMLSPADAPAFRNLVLSVVGIGILFSIIFHVGLKERKRQSTSVVINESNDDDVSQDHMIPSKRKSLSENSPLLHGTKRQSSGIEYQSTAVVCTETPALSWFDWFKKTIFYQMALLYMCTRLVVNLSQVYLTMYLTDSLFLNKTFIAIVPLVVYVSSFLAAVCVRPVALFLKQEQIYLCGSLCVIGACTWAHFLPENSMQIFGLAVVLGIGTSTILVMSLSMTARLIGKETRTGAFVYGAMSLTDKLSNGAAVVIIQNLNPCKCNCPLCAEYFRAIMSYVIGGITIIAMMTIISIITTKRACHTSSCRS